MVKVTIQDVAKKAGVSITTVSRIINGNYNHTTEETKQRVLDAIEQLQYEPNAIARSLKQVKTNVIGIVLSNLKNPFWAEVLEGVEDACRHEGYQLMVCNTNECPDVEEESIRSFRLRQVDGIIVNPTLQNESFFLELEERRVPIVYVNRKYPNIESSCVLIDNVRGSSIAVEHLVKLGYKRVAIFLYDGRHITTWIDRLKGYKTAMLKHGFNEEDLIIQYVAREKGAALKTFSRYLTENEKPDAILSASNRITLEILEGVKNFGFTVPDDIALVSYDETFWAKHIDPPLTTIHQPGYMMGKISAEMLIEKIRAGKDRPYHPQTVVLKPELIVRNSCGSSIKK